ncbi:kinase-like domain-containing protein [Hypomontagnella monticulosa]|nr:kinase-like domain-containing protein [Hypomontagnella monticulosa]
MSIKAALEASSIYYPAGGTARFIPQGDFENFLSIATLRSELSQCLPDHHPGQGQLSSLVETIYSGKEGNPESSFRKIFATLVLIGICHRIVDFVERNINDSQLPLLHEEDAVDAVNANVADKAPVESILVRARDGYTPLDLFSSWDPTSKAGFFKEQWTFLSPIFARIGSQPGHYQLTTNHVLPVVEDGGRIDEPTLRLQEVILVPVQILPRSSLIRRVKLHPQHCRFESPLTGFQEVEDFAWKQIPMSEKSRFIQELGILKSLQCLNDPHIIPLLASFSIPSLGYYLLFPCAEGDLELLWLTRPDLVGSSDTVLWISEQCYHLTNSLARVHGDTRGIDQTSHAPSFSAIIHGDLRPANILWFAKGTALQDSKLVIADWGCAEPDLGPHSGSATQLKSIGRTYRPPECDDSDAHVSVALDIWSLGCIFLEFVTWYLLGWEAVEDTFSVVRLGPDSIRPHIESDTFFSRTEGRWEVKPQVLSWTQKLTEHQGCSPCVQDILSVIMDCMLEVNPAQRSTARTLAIKFHDIFARCEKNPDYYKGINHSQR